MKVAIVTDTHWGVRNDNVVFGNHISAYFTEQFFPEIDRMGITHILHLGDVVDRRKFINFNSASKLEEDFIKPICDRNLFAHIIIGNHDTFYKNTNNINSMKQLYGHSKYAQDNMSLYWDGPVEIVLDGTKIVLCPWICDDNYEKTMEFLKNTDAQILMGHFEIDGFEMYRGVPSHGGLDKNVFSKFDMVMSGHFHHKSSHGNIHYLGAPYEMTWSDYNDPRGFHVFDTETRELEFIQNTSRIFHKLFYNDDGMEVTDISKIAVDKNLKDCYIKVVVQNKNNPYLFDLYINSLQQAGCADIKVVEDHMNLDLFNEEDLIDEAEDTLTILRNYIDKLDMKNSAPVEKFMTSLYNEAINL